MTSLEIRALVVPDSLEAADAADFIAMMRVRNEVWEPIMGPGAVMEPAEQLPRWQLQSSGHRYGFVAETDAGVVGRAFIEVPLEPEATETFGLVDVLPDHRRRGAGTALADAITRIAREQDKPIMQTLFESPARESDEAISPPNGFGSIPADDPGVAFARSRGFELAQVLRTSELRLPLDDEPTSTLERDAADHYATNYELVRWIGPTPDEWIDGIAQLRARMSTDAPMGDLESTETVWDADRVRAADQEWAAGGHQAMTVAARERASGNLVAFSEPMLPPGDKPLANQIDTLVLREHRGRRLGMAVKIANLRWLAERRPDIRSVFTMNAEENVPMLDVNVAIGFRPVRYAGAWKVTLASGAVS